MEIGSVSDWVSAAANIIMAGWLLMLRKTLRNGLPKDIMMKLVFL
jgi:hypothetical protein